MRLRNFLLPLIGIIIMTSCKGATENIEVIPNTHFTKKQLSTSEIDKCFESDDKTYNGKKIGYIYTGQRYRVGAYEHYHKYEITSIKNKYGIYNSFFEWQSVYLIKTGGAETNYSEKRTYSESEGITINFSTSISSIIEVDLYACAGISSEGVNINEDMKSKQKLAINYSEQCYLTRKKIHEIQYNNTLKLNSETVKNFDNGYALNIGKTGQYSIIEFNITTYEIYLDWFTYKHKKINGKEDGTKRIVICNENDLSITYQVRLLSNPNETWYCQ